MLGDGVELISSIKNAEGLQQYLEETDVVINLAGRPLAGIRWTGKKKIEFYESRVTVTNLISDAISICKNPPKVGKYIQMQYARPLVNLRRAGSIAKKLSSQLKDI